MDRCRPSVAAVLAGVLIWLGPPGVDLAAHSYQRTFLLQHGFAIWNNFWYAGRYSFVTYSFIYYPLAALLGIKLLAVVVDRRRRARVRAASSGGSGGRSARFSSRTFAVLWPGIVLSAAFPFALGDDVRAARARRAAARPPTALRGAALPDAAREPARAAAARARARRLRARPAAAPRDRRRDRRRRRRSSSSLRRLFPEQGQFPFSVADLVPGVALRRLGIALTAARPGARRLFGLFAVLLAALHRRVRRAERSRLERRAPQVRGDPARAARGRRRRRRVVLAIAARRRRRVLEHLARSPTRLARPAPTRPTARSYWQPDDRLPARAPQPVATASRPSTRSSTGRPRTSRTRASRSCAAGTARTTSRRTSCSTTARSRRAPTSAWLRGLGVRYVVLTDAPPDYSSRAEAALIRSGRSGLVPGVPQPARRRSTRCRTRARSSPAPGDATVLWLVADPRSSSRSPSRAATASRCAGRRTGRRRRAASGAAPTARCDCRRAHAGLVELSVSRERLARARDADRV